MIPFVLIVTAFFQPPSPTVGDPITIRFEEQVVLDRSRNYEIVSQRGDTVVIRSFQPQPFAISGRTPTVAFRNMTVPMRSVLKPGDNMLPAPLKPPRREPYPRMPFVLIAAAALAAIAAWTAAALRREKAAKPALPALPPAERFRATVLALRAHPHTPYRWARLADAVRDYLAATTELGHDLTTTEVLYGVRASVVAFSTNWSESLPEALTYGSRRSDLSLDTSPGGGESNNRSSNPIEVILHQGDLEKFSPWGAGVGDFNAIADAALELVPEPVVEEKAA